MALLDEVNVDVVKFLVSETFYLTFMNRVFGVKASPYSMLGSRLAWKDLQEDRRFSFTCVRVSVCVRAKEREARDGMSLSCPLCE